MPKTIYFYDYPSGVYKGIGEAQDNPYEEGKYIWDGWATFDKPPETTDIQIAVYDGEKWLIKSNYGKGCLIDIDGYFLDAYEFKIGEETDSTHIIQSIPDVSLYKPKWDGQKWVEGATADYIQSLQPSQTEQIKAQLSDLDTVLPRCVEDMIVAQGTDILKLPQIRQDRLKQKQDLRVHLQQLNALEEN